MGSTAVVVATAALTGYQQYQAGKAESEVSRRNQQLADIAAADALARGAADEQQSRRTFAQIAGEQVSLAGASGLEVNTGSPALLLEDTAMLAELEALTIRNNAQREAWGYEQRSTQFGFESSLALAAGRNAAIGSVGSGVARGVGINRQLSTQRIPRTV